MKTQRQSLLRLGAMLMVLVLLPSCFVTRVYDRHQVLALDPARHDGAQEPLGLVLDNQLVPVQHWASLRLIDKQFIAVPMGTEKAPLKVPASVVRGGYTQNFSATRTGGLLSLFGLVGLSGSSIALAQSAFATPVPSQQQATGRNVAGVTAGISATVLVTAVALLIIGLARRDGADEPLP